MTGYGGTEFPQVKPHMDKSPQVKKPQDQSQMNRSPKAFTSVNAYFASSEGTSRALCSKNASIAFRARSAASGIRWL